MPLVILPVFPSQPTYQLVFTPSSQAPATITLFGYGKKFSNFAKMYIEESKYIRENNSFNFELTIFNNINNRADILFKVCMKAFSTILKAFILDYYYSNIGITSLTMNFDQVYYLIRVYFKGAKYKRNILSK